MSYVTYDIITIVMDMYPSHPGLKGTKMYRMIDLFYT